ncbi:MAG: integrase [Desulfobacteraceae bacterium]|jgi:site-specific recombinase XerD|nr:MAG: integrase [Desulfobacteraceae bacterium]
MTNQFPISPWVRRFLMEHLVTERNLALNTQRSYRDTLRLLLPFIARQSCKPIDRLMVTDLSAENIRQFLLELEQYRHCGISTRNQRLAAIRSLAHFIGMHSPEHLEWCGQIRAIPFKKTTHPAITYLEKNEMDALLAAPDCTTDQGRRDHAVLLFLYNTGARADETAQLTIADLAIAYASQRDHSSVMICGKGNKLRRCPLWSQTVEEIKPLIQGRDPSEGVFLNRCGQPLTRFGIHTMVERYANRIRRQMPSLKTKRISPHSIRHTTATHLLRSGVDINTIRAWLGHVSINTTNIYAEIDLEMKARALAHCEVKESTSSKKLIKHWREDVELMAFLKSL